MQISNMNHNVKRTNFLFLAFLSIFILSFSSSPSKAQEIKTVVLDAGHGGRDPGNLGTGRYKTTEKDIALLVTKKLGSYISENFPDIKLIYTRAGDTFPSLDDRVNIANDAKADLFISIHCDAFTKESARGSGTFVMGMHKTEESLRVAMQENASMFLEEDYEKKYEGFDPNDPDTYIALSLRQNIYLDHSLDLSSKVQNQFKNRVGRIDRGVRQAGYYVISFTTMPSILVELGFLTNKEEEDFLNTEKGQDYMASAVYRAFKEYKLEREQVVIEEPKEETPEKVIESNQVVEIETSNLNDLIAYNKVGNDAYFQVQIMTSSQKIKKSSPDFKGLKIDEYFSNGLYKYAAGRTKDYKEIKKMQQILRDHGFQGAFIIALKNGKRIDLHDALSQNN